MNLRRSILCLVISVLLLGSFTVSALAFEHPLGDLGKPADYDVTIKRFDKATSNAKSSALQSASTSFSWMAQGKVTPPKDQGDCGSCWAFASVGVFESKLLMAGAGINDLSEQQQISCNNEQANCDGGDSTALRYWEWNGPMLESCTLYPSSDASVPLCTDFSCTTLAWRTKGYTDTSYYTIDTTDIEQMKTSLQTDGPAYFRFDVHKDFYTYWDTASSGSVYTQQTNDYSGGHAVLLVGWDDTKQAWLLKNSWGATAGPNGDGTFWMAYTGHLSDLNFGMANTQIYAFLPCGYTEQTATYDSADILTLPSAQVQDLGLADDQVYAYTLPFPFIFYCEQYNNLYIDSNGLIQLTPTVDSVFSNYSLPSTTMTGPLLAPFWMDLAPGTLPANGKVYAAVTGTAPNRTLVIEWKDVPAFNYTVSPTGYLTDGTVTAKMKYFEATGIIEYHYPDTIFADTSTAPYYDYALNNGAKATVGIQRSGEEAVMHSFNKVDGIKSGQAIKYIPPSGKTGQLTVSLSPSAAGGTWSVDGGPAQSSGQTLVLLAGTHTVSFSTVAGYDTPAGQSVTVTAGGTNTATGLYVQQTGSLTVTIAPAAAITAGARWWVDNGTSQSSGTTLSGLSVGTHTISFSSLPTWTTPEKITIIIAKGATSTATGTYVVPAQTGSLTVTLSPAAAVTAGARWWIDNGASQSSGATLSGLSPGSHTLSFSSVSGWTTPTKRAITLTTGANTATGTYVQQTGSLTVTITPAAAVTAGARWWIDSDASQSSGTTLSGLSVGTHTLSFSTLPTWTTPTKTTITITNGGTTTATGIYVAPAQTGSLTVTLSPASAVTAGARWWIDNGASQSSGTTLSGLSPGSHTLSFSSVSGWTSPAKRAITIAAGANTATGTYVQQTGSLTVNITPAEAVTAGARWWIDSGASQSSGTTLSGLSVGTHTLSFSTLPTWTTPAKTTITITNGGTTTASGTYVVPTQTGSLTVTLSPASAVTAGARWWIDNGASQSGGATLSGLSPGSHTLSFSSVSGWTAPVKQAITIATGANTATSTYVQQTGSVTVNITPAEAVTAGARWWIDSGASQSSGTTLSGLSVGTHTLTFSTLPTWTTPVKTTITITNGGTTAATGTYVVPAQTGSLTVTLSPAAAVTAGARWWIDNGASQSSGATLSGLSPGTHTLSFSSVSGWTAPAKRAITITTGANSATGTYTQ